MSARLDRPTVSDVGRNGRLGGGVTSNPEAEATLQRQRGLVPNAVVTTNRLALVGKTAAPEKSWMTNWSKPPKKKMC